jgi:hypothetical protein
MISTVMSPSRWVPMASSGLSGASRILYCVSDRAIAEISAVTFSGAGPPLATLYLMPKSPSGPPRLWLAERMIPPTAPRLRMMQEAAGVDRMPPVPTSTRPTPFAADMRSTTWIASRFR